MPVLNLIRQDAARSLTSTTAEQRLFGSTGNGRLTLPVGTYLYQCIAVITGLSATSGNGAFDLLGAGTAVLGSVLTISTGIDGALSTAAAITGSVFVTAQSGAAQQTAAVGTVWSFLDRGSFEVTTAGTIVPSVTLLTAAAGSVNTGSHFWCQYIGPTDLTTIGAWD